LISEQERLEIDKKAIDLERKFTHEEVMEQYLKDLMMKKPNGVHLGYSLQDMK